MEKVKKVKENDKLPHSRRKMSLFSWVVLVWLSVQVLILYLPLLWGAFSSFKDLADYYGNKLSLPVNWTLSNYAYILKNFSIKVFSHDGIKEVFIEEMLLNTLFLGAGASLTNVLASALFAFILYRYKYFKATKVIKSVIIITMAVPLSSMASELAFFKRIGIFDNILALVILRGNPVNLYTFIFISCFSAVPHCLVDSAEIDGVSRLGLMFRIMFPAAKGLIGLFFLMSMIGYWNDFNLALFYLPTKPTIGFGLYYLNLTSNLADYVTYKLAAALILSAPLVIVFVFLGERMMGGISLAEGLKA